MATSEPFDNGKTFIYLPDHETTIKGNRLPAAVEITVVTLDNLTLDRRGHLVPPMESILTDEGSLDLDASLAVFRQNLLANGFKDARTHTTRVKLTTGS
jgi:hypothetical protein